MSQPSFQILVLPGDGIGPEVMEQAIRILKWVEIQSGVRFDLEYDLAGGCAIDTHGTPLLDETLERARGSHAVLFSSVAVRSGTSSASIFALRSQFSGSVRS